MNGSKLIFTALLALFFTACSSDKASDGLDESSMSMVFDVNQELIESRDTAEELNLVYAIPRDWVEMELIMDQLPTSNKVTFHRAFMSSDSLATNYLYSINDDRTGENLKDSIISIMNSWEGRKAEFVHGKVSMEQWIFMKGNFINLKLFMDQGSHTAVSEFLMTREDYNKYSKTLESVIGTYAFINQ